MIEMRDYLKSKNFKTIFEKGLDAAVNGEVYLEEVKSIIGEIK